MTGRIRIFFQVAIFFLLSGMLMAGWRPGEMKVKVTNATPQAVQQVTALGIEVDFIQLPIVYLYVIPQELRQLEELGFQPETVIPDMAAYSQQLLQSSQLAGYHDYYSTLALVDSLSEVFPNIFAKKVYGVSAGGRSLYAVKISDHVQLDEAEAEIGFDGGHHGDEIMSSEILVRLMRDLCRQYGRDSRVTELINRCEIWFFPYVNPDGRQDLSRRNDNYVDLNRDWGYMWDGWGDSKEPYSQPETRAVLDWLLDNQFVFANSLHTGMELISYPWSYRPNASPDNKIMSFLAGEYATFSGYPEFKSGQGFKSLYPINGSAKDSYYGLFGSAGWTLEICREKTPPASEIKKYYDYNYPAILHLLEMAGKGLRGRVSDAANGQPVKAIIWVKSESGEYWPVYNDPVVGDFHKFLLPGEYSVRITANGYESVSLPEITIADSGAAPLKIQLHPKPERFAHQVVSCRVPGNNFSDDGLTYRVLAAPDRRYYSLGRNGWIVLDMGSTVYDLPGNDIRIMEGDLTPEGYVLLVSRGLNGPWKTIGSGSGTGEFDIAAAPEAIQQFRYVRIEDDGDDFSGIANAGFDLDAVEILTGAEETSPAFATGFRVLDTLSNFNGILESGETVTLQIQITKISPQPVKNVSVRILNDAPEVTVLRDSAFVGNMYLADSSAKVPFVVKAANVSEDRIIPLTIHIRAGNNLYRSQVLSLPIQSGARLMATLEAIAFEGAFVNLPSVEPLTISNGGEDTLKVFRLKTAQMFFRVKDEQLIIAPGEQAVIPIMFQPPDTLFYSDTLTILSNDPHKPQRRLPLSGFGIHAPDIKTSADSISLTLQPSDSAETVLSISNAGAGSLQFALQLLNHQTDSIEIKPGEMFSDGFGYVWLDGNSAEAPQFQWNDPASGQKAPFIGSDSLSKPVTLPFKFSFYGRKYFRVRISARGWINVMAAPDSAEAPAPYETASEMMIAPLWGQLTFGTDSRIVYWNEKDRFVAGWENMLDAEGTALSFQAVIHENGDIEFHYQIPENVQTTFRMGIQDHRPFRRLMIHSGGPYLRSAASILVSRREFIEIYPESGEINPGESAALQIRLRTKNLPRGDYRANLLLESNDPDELQLRIPIHIKVDGESLISGAAEVVPDRFVLFQNYPNPFNPQTTIAFQLPERAATQLVVYNTLGQAVRILVKDELTPGEYRVVWDGKNDFDQQLPSGIYFYELKANEVSRIRKMVLLH